jgi:hypothetical protein
MNNLILEDGYNSDYIYSLIIALFYTPSDGMNKIINTDTNNSNTYFLQEYIKNKFIYPMHRQISIESSTVNKLRLFMYNCGWHKSDDKHILEKGELDKFYSFLIHTMMEYSMRFTRIDSMNNTSKEKKYDMIRITNDNINNSFGSNDIISLSPLINNWLNREVTESDNYNFKFESIPYIIPIYLDIRDSNTGLNDKLIDIMEGINFEDNGDKIQRMFIWEIHSLICQTKDGDYYTLIIDNTNNFIAFSDKQIPSNWKINSDDENSVKKIMQEVRFIFYKLQ